jgi:Tol biopolymer transport system component
VNPDGTDLRRLTSQTTDRATELARWSPDGSEIALTTDFCQEGIVCVAYLVDPDTTSVRTLPKPDPTLPMLCGLAWSVDGLLACGSAHFDSVQSSDGIYTIRASDGGGLTRITNFPANVGDFSPGGRRLVIDVPPESENTHLAVVKLEGGVKRITPRGLSIGSPAEGSWSLDGTWILFSAVRNLEAHRFGIWAVHPDGSRLHRVPIPGCGGLRSDPASVGCLRPHWSPDGTKIAFDLLNPLGFRHIYTVDADGSGLAQVTGSGLEDTDPDWGPHPLSA